MNAAVELSEARRELLQKYLRGEARPSEVKPAAIPQRQDSGPAPLSYSQRQIWLHSQLAGAHLIYNEPITIHRRGDLNIAALERSFTEVVRRHQAWRTTFRWAGDDAAQMVQPAPPHIRIPFVDLRAYAQPEQEAIRLATEDARQPFDLARGPMYRLRLVRLRDDEHRLFLTLHHIIFDGISLYRVLLPELLTCYEAFSKNESPALPKLPIQYPDYARWQRDSITEIPPDHFSYWETALRDLPALELKTDHARPAAQTYAGAMDTFDIAPATTAALKALSHEQGVTLFMTMTAAFMALLQHCTKQEDIVIGGISSGRNREETANLLGCFLNTVPIRCAFSSDTPFVELLARTRRATLGALSHDEVPFELLVQRFARNRDPSRAPLVQALIVVEPPLEPLPAGWDFTHLDVDTGTAKFDLQLGLDDRRDGFRGCFIYNTDLFERDTIEQLRSRWLELLDRIITDPRQRVCDLVAGGIDPGSSRAGEIQTSRGQRPRLQGRKLPPAPWNETRTNYPRDVAIHEIFEQQVQKRPDAVAMVFEKKLLSYDALNRRANQIARRLQKLGVIRDVPVGVWMQRSPEMVIALLAILKSGGAYVPLDPSYPAERLAMMMEDTQMAIILTDERVDREGLRARHAPQLLVVDSNTFADEDEGNLESKAGPDDLAYIMYTSGSTGTPKGAAIPHRAVVRLVKETNYASFAPNETFLQLAPISFDASTFEIWGPLLNGGKLAVMSPVLPALEEIGSAIRDYGVTTLWLTAGLFNTMVDERLDDLRPLRQLLAGGDVLSVSHVGKALAALKNTRLINGYGPTESTTFACCYTIETTAPLENSIPIGKPIANTTAYILDANLQPVPIGTCGELFIGGDGLARGYWRQDELTAEKFVSDPFRRDPGARLYKTGDLARWRRDGVIEFLGRADNQIKLRGFRIEPAEIEFALEQQPGVRDSVVVAQEDASGEKHLVAYVVGSSSEDRLLAALRKSLPDYMVPSAIVALSSLPRTANGKVDRNALPRPDLSGKLRRGDFVAPRTTLEKKLADTWAAVLGVERVGATDNFFDLGGHSLAGLRVVNQLSVALGEHLSPTIFFEAPTLTGMGEFLQEKHAGAVARWMGTPPKLIGATTAVSSHFFRGTGQSPSLHETDANEGVRPYLGLQLELIAIWEEILEARGISIRDNFFARGGDSTRAEKMLEKIGAAFGKTVPLAEFTKNPTVEHLAAELARQASGESSTLLRINDRGSRTPFFYLHGDLFGGGFYSLKLSRALGPDQPFYVMPPHDIRASAQTPTIADMAAAHLQTLRAARPRGPYLIGGFCLGGIVAYELAQQIAAAGEKVEMLLLIDAEPEDRTLSALYRACRSLGRWLRWDEQKQLKQFREWWLRRAQFALWQRESAPKRGRLIIRQLRSRIISGWNALRRNSDDVAAAPITQSGLPGERDVPTAFLWAAASYRPQQYGGAMAVLLSDDLLHRGDHLEQTWTRFAPRATVHSLKGSHLECITAHVDTLAETIDRCLQNIADR
jgi:amino acid adenylation domain-containing protein